MGQQAKAYCYYEPEAQHQSRPQVYRCGSCQSRLASACRRGPFNDYSGSQSASKSPKNKNKKVVQKGGIVTVKGARAAIDARVEQEAAKAARAAARQYKIDAQNAADA
jgi:hypothetical protein